ncbi:TonB-dependent receptor [Haliscomenobacter sp.]|uniref:TonB-dependent receptor n=1 Tax=Haliscomenobacter sp. TaxID=2717303 RepID=UPI003364D13B
MKTHILQCLLAIWLIGCVTHHACAQTQAADLRIRASLEQQPLPVIFQYLEENYPLRFYYPVESLPVGTFSLLVNDLRLEEALQKLLADTPYSFFFYRDYAVIIATREFINQTFAADYYLALERGLNAIRDSSANKKTINIGDIRQLKASGQAKVSGLVLQQKDKTPVIGASVRVIDQNRGSATNEDGRFELELPVGKHQLLIQYIGNADLIQDIQLASDGTLTLSMESAAVNLDEVVVGAKAVDANVENVQIGLTRLDLKSINKLPSFLGETDVIKSLLLSPGVSSIGEGATGFNVRGGEVDQNLVLQDDGILFNSSHALGFFSSFHSDILSRVTLYKSIIPAQYGGRLASVLDVEMRDGNFEKLRIKGGIGPVSSRIAIEGPVIPKKSSFIAGFRSSYSDWVLRSARNVEVRNSSAFFYDANFRYTHRFNEKNTIILAAYASKDQFAYNNAFGFDYQTLMGQAIYKRIFSNKLFSKLSATLSNYESIQHDYAGIDASRLDNNIQSFSLKEQLTFIPRDGLQFDAGLSTIGYATLPGTRQPAGEFSQVFAKTLEKEQGLESAAFVNADWSPDPALQISGGIRFGLYQFLGSKTAFVYQNPELPNLQEITDTILYPKGKTIATYTSLEPRVSARYRFSKDISVKLGYSRTAQFINQIFNSASPTPTSQYQLSTQYIEPTRSHNVSLGYFQNFKDNLWETSVEVYGRAIDQLFDYKDFANLNVNEHLETEILKGKGRAYGMELSIKKNSGLVHGLLSYTLSRTERQIAGINRGEWYPSNFNKPHDLSLVLNYQYNQRHTLTVKFTYGTGRPTTAPQGSYRTPNGVLIPIYSDRNALRIPDYHRLDLAYTIGKDHRKNSKFKTSWTVSLYNAYARRNAFSVYFTQSPLTAGQANRLAVLGTVFPSITFNFETL